MLKQLGSWIALSSPTVLSPVLSNDRINLSPAAVKPSTPFNHRGAALGIFRRRARRRVRYDVEDVGDDEDESYGYNEEIAALEMYSQFYREEALLVTAIVDEQDVQVLIFKGFSSCLSQETATDPSRSVVPERAVIKSIDRIKGPFDPSNIQYLEKGLSWQAFKCRLPST